MKEAAAKLHAMGAQNVVITGGHLGKAIDLLSFTNSRGVLEHELFKAERQRSNSTHGTGCAFSTENAHPVPWVEFISEELTSELQSRVLVVFLLLLEKKISVFL